MEEKRQRAEGKKMKCLCKTAIVYFKCKGYSFEVSIVLSVKPKPKLYEWKERKGLESQWIFKIPVESGKFDRLSFFSQINYCGFKTCVVSWFI